MIRVPPLIDFSSFVLYAITIYYVIAICALFCHVTSARWKLQKLLWGMEWSRLGQNHGFVRDRTFRAKPLYESGRLIFSSISKRAVPGLNAAIDEIHSTQLSLRTIRPTPAIPELDYIWLVSCFASMTSAYSEPWGDLTQRPAMEVMGYSKLQASPPPQAMILELERSLRVRPNVVSGSVIYGRGDHDACEDFLKFGLQESDVCLPTRDHGTGLTIREVH